MASDEHRESAIRTSNPHLPDHLVNFVAFKREMVRLDYTAERLRKACHEVEEQRQKLKEGLRRQENQVTLLRQACDARRLQDDQETLALQAKARKLAERKRVLLAEVEASRQLLDELGRKRNKLQHWLDGLEEHRLFLGEIIAHKVTPRTPSSSARMGVTAANAIDEYYGSDQMTEVMQSPGMIRSRLAHKERNVIAQSRLLFQACQLAEKAPLSIRPFNERNSIATQQLNAGMTGHTDCNSQNNWDQLNSSRNGPPGMQTGLNDANFATVHRLYRKFIAPKSSSCDALNNFAALERYAYFVLQMVDACDPTMLKKIIAKVVVDKRKTMEQQKLANEAAHREERERKALANATSAPAVFRRVTVPVPGRKPRRIPAVEVENTTTNTKINLFRRALSINKGSPDFSGQDVEGSQQVDDLLYLFRIQL